MAKAPHVYTDATDPYCDTCGYVRSMYSVITGENVTAELEDKVLNVPVAADTKVHLTATVPEGKRFTGWTVKVGGEEKEADTFLTQDENDPTKATFTMPSENVEVTANFEGNPTLNIGDHMTANIDDNDASVPSGSAVPVGETVHLTAIAPEGQHFISWTVLVGGEEQKADTFLKTPDADDPTKVSFVMPAENVEIKANFASNPTLNPTLRVGDHVTATIEGSDASVPSGSTVPVPKNKIVHLTATAPGQHFISWTVKVNGVEQDPTFLKPDADDPTKVTFTMPDANVEVTATFADDPIPEPDPVGPSDTGNIQGAISAVVIGAAAGAIIYEAGTGIYRVINMPGIPMPSNRIELAELLWEHAGKPEPVSTALYSDIDEGDTDAQKAARWAVEQDLMKDDADNNKFHPAFPVSKLRTCLTWNAAKEKGLFDKTEE
ncbi:MAG: InlB B-repeat-containing protein [Faecalibacterium sp.]